LLKALHHCFHHLKYPLHSHWFHLIVPEEQNVDASFSCTRLIPSREQSPSLLFPK
jgi:hypothetical protein